MNIHKVLNYHKLRSQRTLRRLFFQRLLGINAEVPWPVHHAARFKWVERIVFPDGMDKFNTVGMFPDQYWQAYNGIVVHRGVRVGQGVKVISANHDMSNFNSHLPAPPIIFDEGCWVGVDAIILPGVHLGPYTVVGAGAVVNRSYSEGHCTLAGVPAAVVRSNNGGEPSGR